MEYQHPRLMSPMLGNYWSVSSREGEVKILEVGGPRATWVLTTVWQCSAHLQHTIPSTEDQARHQVRAVSSNRSPEGCVSPK